MSTKEMKKLLENKVFNLSITEIPVINAMNPASPQGTTITVNTDNVDELQRILNLAGVGSDSGECSSCAAGEAPTSSTPTVGAIDIVSIPDSSDSIESDSIETDDDSYEEDPKSLDDLYNDFNVDEEAGDDEGFANEPDEKISDTKDQLMYGLDRNKQALNNRGKDGADNRLGETEVDIMASLRDLVIETEDEVEEDVLVQKKKEIGDEKLDEKAKSFKDYMNKKETNENVTVRGKLLTEYNNFKKKI